MSFAKEMEKAKNKTNVSTEKTMNNMIIRTRFAKLFVLMRNSRHLEEERVGLHASAVIAGDNAFCLRQQVLSLLFEMDQGEELPVKALQIFAAGSSIHEKWQNMLEACTGEEGNNIRLVKNEARSFNEKYDIFYTPDSIIEMDGELYIVEYKSMNTYAYQGALKSTNPHPSARKQAQLYMHLTGIPHAIILIEDKNTQDFMTYKISYNYEEVLPFLDRLIEIQEYKQDYLKDGTLPSRCCKNADTKRACDCGMRSACFNVGKGRIEL